MRKALSLALTFLLLQPVQSYACGVCFNSLGESKQLIALRIAIATMLIVLGTLAIGITGFFIKMHRKSKNTLVYQNN